MTPLGIVLVLFGLLIAASRAPLIFAPAATRTFYLKWFETDARMRVLGLLVLAIGIALILVGGTEKGALASIVYRLGLFMGLMGPLFFLIPGPVGKLAAGIWSKFSDTTLRVMGTIAVIFGLTVAAYGLNL